MPSSAAACGRKLEFVTEDVAAEADPTDQDLRTYLKAHPRLNASRSVIRYLTTIIFGPL